MRIGENYKRVILFGAASPFSEPYKGFHSFLEVLKILTKNERPDETLVMTFGSLHIKSGWLKGIAHKHFDSVRSTEFLSLIYNAADVMAVASEMESFCLVAAEAEACGVPVVCFDTSGLKDVVDHKKTGYRAELQNYQDFADGIHWVLDDPANYRALCKNAREKCLAQFDAPVVAKKHYDAYKNALQLHAGYALMLHIEFWIHFLFLLTINFYFLKKFHFLKLDEKVFAGVILTWAALIFSAFALALLIYLATIIFMLALLFF